MLSSSFRCDQVNKYEMLFWSYFVELFKLDLNVQQTHLRWLFWLQIRTQSLLALPYKDPSFSLHTLYWKQKGCARRTLPEFWSVSLFYFMLWHCYNLALALSNIVDSWSASRSNVLLGTITFNMCQCFFLRWKDKLIFQHPPTEIRPEKGRGASNPVCISTRRFLPRRFDVFASLHRLAGDDERPRDVPQPPGANVIKLFTVVSYA